MSVRAGVLVSLIAALLVGAGPIAAVTGAATGTEAEAGTAVAEQESSPFAIQQDEIDADDVRMDVALRPNGTAEWTVEFWVHLDDENRTAAFESMRDDIRENPDNYTQSFGERMNETVAAASDATGREMSADGFAVETARQSFGSEYGRDYGVVRYTFRWHGFAAVDGDELHAGDAIEGFYLDDNTRLLVAWPDEYELTSVEPEPDDRRDHAAIWRGGDTEFVSGEPRLVVAESGIAPSTGSTSMLLAAAAAVAVLAGLGAAGVWWYRNRSWPLERPSDAADGDDGAKSDGDARATDSATADSAEPAQSSGSTAPAPDPELLTNEEQVIRLIRQNGGRMKQQAVVEELGWTDAKTSKVVTGLREEGKLESFRLGRENVLSLPEADEGIDLEATGASTSNGGDDSA